MDYEEEQVTEIEALESIYYDSFTVLSKQPHSFELLITGEADDDDDENRLSVKLQFTFTPKYPEEAPTFEILECTNIENEEEKIVELINEEIQNNLGMAMVFTISSAVQEYLNGVKDEIKRREEEELIRIEREQEEAEKKKFHGTPVTVETFLAWKLKFEEEMKELKRLKEKAEGDRRKMTGKELFLSDKNILENEVLEGEESGVKIDESLFEDLDDLDLDDDPDFDPDDYS